VNDKSSAITRKTIIIGLDGSTWDNLWPWVERGDLPFLKELVEGGTRATLVTTIPTSTIPALPTLYTGMNPGEHGILKFTKPNGEVVNMSDVAYPKLWNILDTHGLRSLVFNVRFTYPSDPFNGIMFPGNPHPPDATDLTYPRELFREYGEFYDRRLYDKLVSLYGNVPLNKERILEATIQISQWKYDVFRKLLDREDFDFIFYWNGRSDGGMHMLWNWPELVLELYRHLEGLVKETIARFPGANVIILSDHGFHQAASLRFHVNNYLEQQGLLVRTGGRVQRKVTDIISGLGRNYIPSWLVTWVLSKRKKKDQADGIGKKAERAVSGKEPTSEPRLYAKSLTNHPGIDYKRSKAVQRELWGIDLLGYGDDQEYKELADRVIKALLDARHEGEPIVSFATKKQELYLGKYLDDIPDIIFLTHGKFIAEYELSSRIVSKPRGKSKIKKYGEHKNARKGIFIASGPDIREGATIGEMNIQDVVPTVLHLFKKQVPEYLNGRVLTEVFRAPAEPSYSNDPPEHYLGSQEKKELSAEEKEEMKERLRSLGYFDEV